MVRLPIPLIQWIDAIAEREGVTRAEVVRWAVREWKRSQDSAAADSAGTPFNRSRKSASGRNKRGERSSPRVQDYTGRRVAASGTR